jgi:cytochrome P450
MTTANAVPHADLMDPAVFREDRELGLFDELRASDPVHWNAPSEFGPGFWSLTRHRDVKAAAADNGRLSSAQGTQIVDRKVEGRLASLHNMDDPEHGKLRKITIPHLRAVEIRQWQQVIDECVAVLLDDAEHQREFDLVPVVSARLPMLVLSRVLGVPAPDAPRMVDWTNRLTSSDPGEEVDQTALAEARDEVMAYFADLTERRRREPTKDLISVLANAEIDSRPLSWGELAAYYIVLVAAGNETTRHLISGAAVGLAEDPGSWDRLAARPELVVPAVEEMFRWVSPVAAMRRTALEPMELGGKSIAAGDRVVLWFSAANHDPEMFAQPRQFQVDRAPNDHLTFGWGVHFCLGAHLARAEIRALFAELVRRRLRFEPAGAPVRSDFNIFRGWQSVPVRVVQA